MTFAGNTKDTFDPRKGDERCLARGTTPLCLELLEAFSHDRNGMAVMCQLCNGSLLAFATRRRLLEIMP